MTKSFLMFFVALLIALISSSAFAYTIPETQFFSGIPNINGPLTFNQFDNQGGTRVLQSINISLTLQASGGYFKIDNDDTNSVSGTFEFGANAAISTTDVILKDSSSQDIPAQAAAYHSGAFNLAANVGDGVGDYDPTGPDGMFYNGGIENSITSGSIGNAFWSSGTKGFMGTGTYNIDFSVARRAQCSSLGIEYQSSPPPSTFGFVTVLYTYDVVPEPATICLLAFGGLVFLTKKQ